jgi:hypothetical protein
MPLSETPNQRAWREFAGQVCPGCNNSKRPNNGFCSKCYYSLPKDMQKALWNRFGSGYEESHEDARDWLEQERRAHL